MCHALDAAGTELRKDAGTEERRDSCEPVTAYQGITSRATIRPTDCARTVS